MKLRRLGETNLKLSPIGLGSWQFSNQKGFGAKFWQPMNYDLMKAIVKMSFEHGINWIDTAEAYGNGESEKVIGNILKELKPAIQTETYIADKWWPLARTASSISGTIHNRLNYLKLNQIDLYQIHHPTSFSSIEKQILEMCKLVEQQKIKYIGVSNFSAKQMEKSAVYLKDAGAVLASNQVCYNLINRKIENNGVLETAKKLGVSIIAYSPLQQGLLTGKFHEDPNKLKDLFWFKKIQNGFNEKKLEDTQSLIDSLKNIGNKHNAKPAQVALNWLIHSHDEMVFAIPGASSLNQVHQNVASLDFQLTKEEFEELNTFWRK